MIDRRPYDILTKAEDFVKNYGDHGWFCEQYTLYRQYQGVLPSLEEALREQGLWETFLKIVPEAA